MRPEAQAARQALAAGDFNAAAQIAAKLGGRTAQEQSEAYFLMAMALDGVGKVREALTCAAKAMKLDSNAETCTHCGRLAVQLHEDAHAKAAADEAAGHKPQDAYTLDTLGNIYARLGDHETAIGIFEQAVAKVPENTGYRFNLAASYSFFGQTQQAETHYKDILKRDPGHSRAYLGLVRLRKQTTTLPALKDAIAHAKTAEDDVRLRYSAAKIAEDLGAHDEVYDYLSKANARHKAHHKTSIDLEVANFEAIDAAFAREAYFKGSGLNTHAPIFVTGMPRTGTTLTDRILSSHPQVTSAGELQAMPLAIKYAAQTPSRAILDQETIAALADTSPQSVGTAYLNAARQQDGAHAGRFVDKLPLNFLYIGYIARALPDAPIICLRRSPMDTVWSNYKNLFATSSLYYRYSYDLEDAARYYIYFDRLMTYWKALFPGRIFELSYEGLIADQEGQTRALLKHCGLEWEPVCLDFHQNDAAVATPSAAQVRQPLSNKSVGFWRHYEAHLGGVKALFEDAGIDAF